MSENPSKIARKHAEDLYAKIGDRFTSRLTCGAEGNEPWWDWLALYLPDAFEAALEAQLAESPDQRLDREREAHRRDNTVLAAKVQELRMIVAKVGESLRDVRAENALLRGLIGKKTS